MHPDLSPAFRRAALLAWAVVQVGAAAACARSAQARSPADGGAPDVGFADAPEVPAHWLDPGVDPIGPNSAGENYAVRFGLSVSERPAPLPAKLRARPPRTLETFASWSDEPPFDYVRVRLCAGDETMLRRVLAAVAAAPRASRRMLEGEYIHAMKCSLEMPCGRAADWVRRYPESKIAASYGLACARPEDTASIAARELDAFEIAYWLDSLNFRGHGNHPLPWAPKLLEVYRRFADDPGDGRRARYQIAKLAWFVVRSARAVGEERAVHALLGELDPEAAAMLEHQLGRPSLDAYEMPPELQEPSRVHRIGGESVLGWVLNHSHEPALVVRVLRECAKKQLASSISSCLPPLAQRDWMAAHEIAANRLAVESTQRRAADEEWTGFRRRQDNTTLLLVAAFSTREQAARALVSIGVLPADDGGDVSSIEEALVRAGRSLRLPPNSNTEALHAAATLSPTLADAHFWVEQADGAKTAFGWRAGKLYSVSIDSGETTDAGAVVALLNAMLAAAARPERFIDLWVDPITRHAVLLRPDALQNAEQLGLLFPAERTPERTRRFIPVRQYVDALRRRE